MSRTFEDSIKIREEALPLLEKMIKTGVDKTEFRRLYKKLSGYANNRVCGLDLDASKEIGSISTELGGLYNSLKEELEFLRPTEDEVKESLTKAYKTLEKVAQEYDLA